MEDLTTFIERSEKKFPKETTFKLKKSWKRGKAQWNRESCFRKGKSPGSHIHTAHKHTSCSQNSLC